MERGTYVDDLGKNAANFVPLSPVSFLARSAEAFPEKVAVIDGERRFTYRQFHERSRKFASALKRRGIEKGETVAVLAPNVPALLEAHFAVPLAGGVLNALNTRLDAGAIAFCLNHAEAKLILVDGEYLDLLKVALDDVTTEIGIVVIAAADNSAHGKMDHGDMDYEAFLATGDAADTHDRLADEWAAISLGYTSGTTGNPKGVVCHHRGAYLNALGNVLAAHLDERSVYLWTLPMFHCNGWSHTWAVTAVGGTHVCLRKIDPAEILALVARERITHMSAAPVVLNMLAQAPEIAGVRFAHSVNILTGGAAPPTPVMTAMENAGFNIMHIYGLTETTGPSLICEWRHDWEELSREQRMHLNTRQGIKLATLEEAVVADPETCEEVARDGKTTGEIMLRGNTVMMGYLKNPSASAEALDKGWFHTGDIAVRHADGNIEIKDRAKDVIISGGENISSVEIEEVLHRHPAVLEVAVVARMDEKWGEHPCAFICFKKDTAAATPAELTDYCRANMARFKVPRTFVFGDLPKTSTGKVQKHFLRARANSL